MPVLYPYINEALCSGVLCANIHSQDLRSLRCRYRSASTLISPGKHSDMSAKPAPGTRFSSSRMAPRVPMVSRGLSACVIRRSSLGSSDRRPHRLAARVLGPLVHPCSDDSPTSPGAVAIFRPLVHLSLPLITSQDTAPAIMFCAIAVASVRVRYRKFTFKPDALMTRRTHGMTRRRCIHGVSGSFELCNMSSISG